ncbi:hypothetical protein ACOMHN_032168 [Nucella lapillus]
MSSSNGWVSARVPVNTTSDLSVIFEARSVEDHTVCIDDIAYKKEECDLWPAAALPPPMTTSSTPQPTSTVQTTTFVPETTTTTITTTATTSLTEVNTQSPSKLAVATTDLVKTTSGSTESGGNASAASSQTKKTPPAGPSSNIGLIVGVVVAVVVLILIGLVVLYILFRRKQIHRTCFRKQKRKEEGFQVKVSHNAGYKLEKPEPDRFEIVDVNTKRFDSHTQQQGNRESLTSPPVEDDYSVITHTADGAGFDPSEAENEYAEVDRPNALNMKQQTDPDPEESPYEIGDAVDTIPPNPPPPEDDYNQLNFHRSGHGDRHDEKPPSMDQNSDYSHLVSNVANTRPTTDGYEDPGLYQNRNNSFKARNQQPTSELYQNVHDMTTPGTQEPQQETGSVHIPGHHPDLVKEDQSVGGYHLPMAMSSKPEPLLDQTGAHDLPPTNSPHTSGSVYAVPRKQAPSTLHPEDTKTYSNDRSGEYNHLASHENTQTSSSDKSEEYNHLASLQPENAQTYSNDRSEEYNHLASLQPENNQISSLNNSEEYNHLASLRPENTQIYSNDRSGEYCNHLASLQPENVQTSSLDKSEDYNQLDFEGKRVVKQRKDDEPVALYSRLNEEVEGDYDEIDRNRRTEVINEDYAHI